MVWTSETIMLAVIGAMVFAIFITSIVAVVKSESCTDSQKGTQGTHGGWNSVVNPFATVGAAGSSSGSAGGGGGNGFVPFRTAAAAPISRR